MRRRLVLRAPPPSGLDGLRRLLATLFALTPLALALAVHALGGWSALHLVWLVPLGVGVALGLVLEAPPELTELGFDGASGSVWVEERGPAFSRARRREVRLSGAQPLALIGGVLTAHPRELGLLLEVDGRPFTGAFAVAGLERRADLAELATRVALRLGRSVLRVRDDLDRVRFFCGQAGDQPSAAREGGGYRVASDEAPLAFTPRGGFDAPTTLPPPLDPSASGALAGELLRADTGELALTPAPARPPFGLAGLVGGLLLGSLGAIFLAQPFDAPPAAASTLSQFGVTLLLGGSLAMVLSIRRDGEVWVARVGRALGRMLGRVLGRGALGAPEWGVLRPRRATLHADALELHLRGRAAALHLTSAELVLVERYLDADTGRGAVRQGLALFVLAGGRWYRLATTRPGETEGSGASVLRRAAFEVAKALDAPLRVEAGGVV